jgi:tetratricopeptide (TPR) repeat protein
VALVALERYEEALVCYEHSLRSNPSDLLVLVNKGRALARLKRYSEALACFNSVLRVNPENMDARYNKGVALTALATNEAVSSQ